MNKILSQLQPKEVWEHFENISQIPRASKKEKQIVEYVLNFAKEHQLEAYKDKVGNVIIKKNATSGMEHRPSVLLQSHLDMVTQKSDTSEHNFDKDPLALRIVDQLVKATNTTLGADNGIGVAIMLAILQAKNIKHGPIETLFTIDEETGMTGANGLQSGLFSSNILLNLDTEDDKEITIGCAGGVDVKASFNLKESEIPTTMTSIKLSVHGLFGGHSGGEIHLGRGNANKILARILYTASHEINLRLIKFSGGNMRNAIPRSASATIVLPTKEYELFEQISINCAQDIKKELEAIDPGMQFDYEKIRKPMKAITTKDTQKFLQALIACPNGMMARIREMPNVTETSTNMAIVTLEKGKAHVISMVRSSIDSKKYALAQQIKAVFELVQAEVDIHGSYPGWQPNPTSKILATIKEQYEKKYGEPPHITATHGGLECGIIRSKYPDLEAISIGPTIRDAHTPEENVEIASVKRFYEFLLDVLSHI